VNPLFERSAKTLDRARRGDAFPTAPAAPTPASPTRTP